MDSQYQYQQSSSKRKQVESYRERIKTPRLKNPLDDCKSSSYRAMNVQSEREMRSDSRRSNSNANNNRNNNKNTSVKTEKYHY